MVGSRRYAHPECALIADQKKTQEEKDKAELEEYIIKLLNIDYIDPKIRKQINKYTNEYKYTYSGIRKALIYFYELKNNDIEKANGGIGIVPHIYKEAYDYYLAIYQAQQRNENKIIESYIPTVKTITIKQPKRKAKKRNLFKFLEEEEKENVQ